MPANTRLISADKLTSEEDILRSQQKNMRRSGLVLAEEHVVQTMENTIAGEGRFIPVKFSSDGELRITNALATAEQFARLRAYTEKLLNRMAVEIYKGKNEAVPKISKYNPCSFCEYTAVCQFDPTTGTDEAEIVKSISKSEFFERI